MRLMLCAVAVCAQVLAQAPAPAALSPAAALLERNLRDTKTGFLVVVEGPKEEWKAGIDALNTDPGWIDLDLNVAQAIAIATIKVGSQRNYNAIGYIVRLESLFSALSLRDFNAFN